MNKRKPVRWAGALLLAGVIAGCASAPPPAPRTRVETPVQTPAETAPEASSRPRTANPSGLNLHGFPVAFREGYTAGCESGRHGGKQRDEVRYKADMNYMMGWNDGYSICARK